MLLSGGETNAQSTCSEDNGAFSLFVFIVAGDKGTAPTLRHADQHKPKEETYTDGTRTSTPTAALKVPADCSAHLHADSSAQRPRRLQRAPLCRQQRAPRWAADGTTLHVLDHLRGIEVLTSDRGAAHPPRPRCASQ